ncbi:MAG: hypothetical protein IT410_04010 [Candidatus Doudnabacteria bacterium]|nr:hypothetical protein [Candidatus Doudnabacteria bacterium]
MEKLIGLKEFRENVEAVTKKVNSGQSFIVLKKSKPLFRISPISDELNWKTIIDFTEIKKDGIPVEDIANALRNGQDKKSSRKTTKRI